MLWTVAGGLFAVSEGLFAVFALTQTPPGIGVHILIGALLLAGTALMYGLFRHAWPRLAPGGEAVLEQLWPLAIGTLAILVLEAGIGAGMKNAPLDSNTLLPQHPLAIAAVVLATTVEGVFAAAVLARLRPLVLFRSRRVPAMLWTVMLVGMLATAITLLSARGPILERPEPSIPALLFAGITCLSALVLALRQGWITTLSPPRRLGAGLIVLIFGCALLAFLYIRMKGLATVAIYGDDMAFLPVSFIMSRALAGPASLVASFGILFSATALLVLVFQLPTAGGTTRQDTERRALHSLVTLSGGELDREAIAGTAVAAPVNAGLGDAAWLLLTHVRSGIGKPSLAATHGIEESIAEAAADGPALHEHAKEVGSLLLDPATIDHRVHARPGDGIGSLVALPIGGDGQDHGLLLVSRKTVGAFSANDVVALETFAAQAGLALSHGELFEEALERERLTRELDLAREVQQRLFPQTLPSLPGFDLAAAENPAREIGGDYYDAIALPENRLGLIVADVSGKGTGPAFYMAELKGIFQSAAPLANSPADFLIRANEALASSLGRGVFVSALYAVIDADGHLQLARAGHCPALLATEAGPRFLRPDGLALGLARDPLFSNTLAQESVRLAPGDALALFTDGLVEARNSQEDFFGYDRLSEVHQTYRHLPAEQLRDALLEKRNAFASADEPQDDLTLVVLTYTGNKSTTLKP